MCTIVGYECDAIMALATAAGVVVGLIAARKAAWDHDTDTFNDSRLEGILEFFEKVAHFQALGVLDGPLVQGSTLGWYAAHYYLYARSEIPRLGQRWEDELYTDLRALYDAYATAEARASGLAVPQWEERKLQKRRDFFMQEKMD